MTIIIIIISAGMSSDLTPLLVRPRISMDNTLSERE